MPNKNLTSDEVRQMFLDYFLTKGSMIEPGASLIPHNDPTLLWINAGVAPLKKYFDGTEKPKCNRIHNAQKSIRTNDIENVGKTARHHTFFEMLGNFSIGDYFKEEAIPYAWEFLTSPEWIGFDKEKMYVTIYPDDDEAYRIWTTKTDVNPAHIKKTEDNFWEIGEGPGGPDSEIFYDRGEAYDPEGLGEKLFFDDIENDRYIEVWNVVFSQYDCKPDEMPRSEYKELPQKNIDTGMGLERLVCLIQGVETNFDTDLFLPIIHATEKMAKHPYSDREYKMAYRVIADHIRTVTFALADGASFSNEGRGYVLRRVLRRAVRYGIKLGIEDSFMYELVPVVAENMKVFYPYLMDKIDLVSRQVKTEEEAFHSTLAKGESLLQEELKNYADTKLLPGELVFKLYDTYGFPKELTQEIAEENGYEVDLEGFDKEMQLQKQRARDARSEDESMSSQSEDLMNFDKPFVFTGYTNFKSHGVVTGLFKDGKTVQSINDEGDVIISESCFYAESGGQIYDTGTLFNDTFKGNVTEVKKAPNKQHIHHVVVENGVINVGDELDGEIDVDRRLKTMANHSSLHLLQSALKSIVGDHINQAGSFCGPDYARFDFTHFQKVTDEELHKIERCVNEMIEADADVTWEEMPIEDAKNSGAIALFDEKYGDTVRVVTMGDFSKEFCGGTHVSNTGNIGVFKIISEESIGSGVRRITVRTKMDAYNEFKGIEDYLYESARLLKTQNIKDVNNKIMQLITENNNLKRELAEAKSSALADKANAELDNKEVVDDLEVLFVRMDGIEPNGLKDHAELLRNKLKNGLVFITSVNEGKITFVCAASKEAINKGFKAGDLVKSAAVITGGNGGGRPDMAQAGGRDIEQVDNAIAEVRKQLNLD